MSEVTCNTIGGIFPLYVDGVVSDDTRNMVTRHLESCKECHKKYEAMKSEVAIPCMFNNSRYYCYHILRLFYLQSLCLPRKNCG